MKILRSSAAPFATYYNCHIETGEHSKFQIGERILFDDGDVITGPYRIVGYDTRRLVVTADDDYTIYERVGLDEVDLDDLVPIVELDYEPVTSSIFLDGFLGAAYQDDSGIVRVDIQSSLDGLKDYYINLMNENGIEYRLTEEGFVFPDSSVIQEVFSRRRDLMPPKYVIGFISSFIVRSKIRINRNPRYEKYMFSLPAAEDFYGGVAPEGLYYNMQRGHRALFSIFGSFEPLAYYIDSIDSNTDEPIFGETIHIDDVFLEVAPELIIKSFALTGCNPRPLGVDGPVTYCNVTLKNGDYLRSAVIAIATAEAKLREKIDYRVFFEGRKPKIYNLARTEGKKNVAEDLFYHPAFNYSKELRDYLQIIFNKM